MAINSLSASSNGISGLASGMNTQDIVEKLLTGTQSKIDKAGQKKTTLQYKQTMYRDVNAKLLALQSKYMDILSKSSLRNNSFYNALNTTITPPSGTSAAFSVSASTSAKAGNVTMDYIKQLATAKAYKSAGASTGDVSTSLNTGSLDALLGKYTGEDNAAATLNIKVGDTTYEMKDAAKKLAGKSPSEVATVLNGFFAENNVGAEAKFVNNKLQITADDASQKISFSGNGSDSVAMNMFGKSLVEGTGSVSVAVDTNKYMPSITVNLDGRSQNITMSFEALVAAAGGDVSQLETDLSAKLSRAFGTGVGVELKNGQLEFKTDIDSQKLTITGDRTVMDALGMKSGISNKLNTSHSLSNLNFDTALQGSQQVFSINGVEFSFSSNTTLSSIMSTINSSNAGVKISYVEADDTFIIQNAETGAGTADFELKQTEGNLLNVLFGVEGGQNLTGSAITKDITGSSQVTDAMVENGGSFTLNVNGTNRTFKVELGEDEDPISLDEYVSRLNEQLASAYGKDTAGVANIQMANDNGILSIHSNNPSYTAKVAAPGDEGLDLGFVEGDSTLATSGELTLADIGLDFSGGGSIKVGGVEITASELGGNTTLNRVAELIEEKLQGAGLADASVSYDSKTAAFRIMGVDIPMEIVVSGTNDDNKLFGNSRLELSKAADDARLDKDYEKGQNAVFKLNGSEIERASNTFTIDGMTYTLNATTLKDPNDVNSGYQPATQITVSRDTDKILDGITEFLDMYNETVDYIVDLYRAETSYKNYAPLTDAQKKEMSDREIELWEAKSKEGLLRSDPYLEKALSALRGAMNTQTSGGALYDIGISTSFYSNEGNFQATSVDKLREAIEADPDRIRQMFAGEDGIMNKLNTAIDAAAKSSFASPGYITKIAGSATMETSSSIYKQITEINKQMTRLEIQYQTEYSRYWSQFNSMETMISQMNTQSSWLTSSFG